MLSIGLLKLKGFPGWREILECACGAFEQPPLCMREDVGDPFHSPRRRPLGQKGDQVVERKHRAWLPKKAGAVEGLSSGPIPGRRANNGPVMRLPSSKSALRNSTDA